MAEEPEIKTPGNQGERVDESDPLVGCVLSGKYRILERIGEGGMSVVYKAHDQMLDRPVAIKCLTGEMAEDGITRFRREGIATGKLENPHIVNVHELFLEPQQNPYLVMDYVQGEPLSLLIRKDSGLPVDRALHIIRQTAEALEHAHSRGIIHRDIKPSNILVTTLGDKSDFVKLLDFGIAKLLTPGEHGQKLTQAGDVFGSPMYMSPEQCSGRAVDARSDIYSLGCLFYEMLVGEPPLVGENALQTFRKHMDEPPSKPSEVRPIKGLSAAIEHVIMKCLQKDPQKRYQNLQSFIDDLNKAESSPYSFALSQFSISRMQITPTIAIALTVLVLGILTFLFSKLSHLPQTSKIVETSSQKPAQTSNTTSSATHGDLNSSPSEISKLTSPPLTTSTAHETAATPRVDTPLARELKSKEDDAENDMENKEYKKAEQKFFNLLPMAVSVYGADSREYTSSLERLLAAAANAHDFAYAERTANLALDNRQKLSDESGMARLNAWIGWLEHKLGRDAQAMDYFNKSFSSGVKASHSLMLYADFLKDLNRNEEAETRYYEALDQADKEHNYKSGKAILKHLQGFYKATKRPTKLEEAQKLEAQYLQKWNIN